MEYVLYIVGFLFVLAIVVYLARFHSGPCPSSLSFLLENPYVNSFAGSRTILDRLNIEPGMRVLDVGCGPGRLTIPAAQLVGSTGEVIALDIQPAMLAKLEKRMKDQKIENIRTILGGIGEGLLDHDSFDRAWLVTVLGEIPDPTRAVQEIFHSLKPGGILSVTELLPDPHYQTRTKVRRLAETAGFNFQEQFGTWLMFTMHFVKP